MAAETKTVNVDDVTQQGKEQLAHRLATIEELAQAHNERVEVAAEARRRVAAVEAEVAELVRAAEKTNKERYETALKAGWTHRDLRGLGLQLPTRMTQQKRQRRAPSSRPTSRTDAGAMAPQQPGSDPGASTQNPPRRESDTPAAG